MAAISRDVVVIGGGPAGEVVAGRLAQRGLSVAMVEDRLVGGECSYWACMPSKALLAPGHALAEARRVPGAREAITGDVDAAAALARRDEVIHGLDDSGQLEWLERARHRIRPRPGADRRPAARGRRRARAHGVARGRDGDRQRAADPAGPGLEDAAPWTNREATTAHAVPARLAVLGGGPVGCELAQAYATLGSAVWLVETLPRLLSREEEFASAAVGDALREAGVEVRCDAAVESAERRDDGPLALTLRGGERIEADEVLVAAGRRPATASLGLEQLGHPIDDDAPLADATGFAVGGSDWLYAIGDVAGSGTADARGQEPGPAGSLTRWPAGPPTARRPPLGTACAPRLLHRAAGRRRRAHARERARGGVGASAPDADIAAPPARASAARGSRRHAAGRRTSAATSSSARRSSAPTSPTCCTRRRSPWSPRSRSRSSARRRPRSRPAPRSGCLCWGSTPDGHGRAPTRRGRRDSPAWRPLSAPAKAPAMEIGMQDDQAIVYRWHDRPLALSQFRAIGGTRVRINVMHRYGPGAARRTTTPTRSSIRSPSTTPRSTRSRDAGLTPQLTLVWYGQSDPAGDRRWMESKAAAHFAPVVDRYSVLNEPDLTIPAADDCDAGDDPPADQRRQRSRSLPQGARASATCESASACAAAARSSAPGARSTCARSPG